MALVVKIFLLLLCIISFGIHNAALHKTRELTDNHKKIGPAFNKPNLLPVGALNIPVLVNIYDKNTFGGFAPDVAGLGAPEVLIDLALVTSPLFSAIMYLWAAGVIFWLFAKFTKLFHIVIILLFLASIALYFIQGVSLFHHQQASLKTIGLQTSYDELVDTGFNVTSSVVRAMMKGTE